MKKYFGAILLTGLFASLPAAAAQAQEGRPEQLEERVAEARERLDLTDEQVEQIQPIIESGMQATRAVLEENGIDLEARTASGSQRRLGLRQKRAIGRELGEISAEVREQMSEFLTDEQLAEYKKIQEERRAEMRERVRAGRN